MIAKQTDILSIKKKKKKNSSQVSLWGEEEKKKTTTPILKTSKNTWQMTPGRKGNNVGLPDTILDTQLNLNFRQITKNCYSKLLYLV